MGRSKVAVAPQTLGGSLAAARNLWSPVTAAAVAVGAAVVHLAENSAYHRHLDHLPDPSVVRVACLQTENGFYYSYYNSLVDAGSVATGLSEIIWDTRSEYPDTLNALRRFNIYQEVCLALLYRALRTCGLALVDAWSFFRATLLLHTSVGQAALALMTSELSGNPLAGVLCFLLSFLNRFQMSRFGSYASADLREHWGIPLLWVQILLLWHLTAGARRGGRRRRTLWLGFGLTTFLFIVSWQFSPFLLLLQATSLYFVCLVCGYASLRPVVVGVVNAYLISMLAASTVHFGSPYLLTSPFLAQVVALKVSTSLRSLCLGCGSRPGAAAKGGTGAMISWFGSRCLDVLEGLVALAGFALALKAVAPFATADTHVYDILCTKAAVVNGWLPQAFQLPDSRLPECTEPSFNARLYLIMGVFKEIEADSLRLYNTTTAGPAAAVTCGLVFLRCLLGPVFRRGAPASSEAQAVTGAQAPEDKGSTASGGLRKRKGGGKAESTQPTPNSASSAKAAGGQAAPPEEDCKSARGGDDCEEAALLLFVVQFLFFLLLGFLVNRLRVAFGPPMMVLAASCFGPRLFAWGRGGRARLPWLAFLVALHVGYLLHVAGMLPCAGDEEGICGQMSEKKTHDGDLVDLMEWMNERLPQSLPVLASMNLAGTLRAFTGNPMIIHPQFESENLRKRVQRAYELYHCGSEESFAETMTSLHAKVVIFEYARCFFTPYILDDRRKNCINGKHRPEDQLCLKLHASPGRFKLLFMNGGFGVFELQEETDGRGSLSDLSPAAVGAALEEPRTWARYVESCAAEQGEACAARLAESVATWYHGLKRFKVASTLRKLLMQRFPKDPIASYYMARYLDFDAKRQQEAGKYYEFAARLLPDNPLAQKEYLMWLDLFAKDKAKIKKFLESRLRPGKAGKALLQLSGANAPDLFCEAAISARDVGLADFGDRLWARAVELAPLSGCIRNNWPLIHPDDEYEKVHDRWTRHRLFLRAGVTHEVGAHHGPGVRFGEGRAFRLSPQGGGGEGR